MQLSLDIFTVVLDYSASNNARPHGPASAGAVLQCTFMYCLLKQEQRYLHRVLSGPGLPRIQPTGRHSTLRSHRHF